MSEFRFSEEIQFPVQYYYFVQPPAKPTCPNGFYSVENYAAKLFRSILQYNNFSEVDSDEIFNVAVGGALDDFTRFRSFQKHIHFQFTFKLGSKSGYHGLMKKFPSSFYPETYHLPEEYQALSQAFSTRKFWIMKPGGGARGNGISILTELPNKGKKDYVVQAYIEHPLLIEKRKFDLRVYVGVASIDPIKIYVHESGLVRIAAKPYLENIDNTSLHSAHLTNYAINKKEKEFEQTNDIEKDGTGNKWTLNSFWKFLEKQKINSNEIRNKIEDAIVNTIFSAKEVFSKQKNVRASFELFGFDVMIDENLNIFILEVNVSPAMGTASKLDLFIKQPVLTDFFNIGLIPIPSPAIETINSKSNNVAIKQMIIIAEYEIIKERSGGFKCVYPTKERFYSLGYLLKKESSSDKFLRDYIMNEQKKEFTKSIFDKFVTEMSRS